MRGGYRATVLGELMRPLVGRWWTVVAGLCIGLAAGIWAYDRVPWPGPEPGPVRVWLLGVAIGLIVFAGPTLVRSAVDPLLFREETLRALLGVCVVASIPRIPTRDAVGESRRRLLVNVALSLTSVAVLAGVTTWILVSSP